MALLDEFITLVSKGDFNNARLLLEKVKGLSAAQKQNDNLPGLEAKDELLSLKKYKDASGNTLMHLVIEMYLKSIKELYKPFANYGTVIDSYLPKDQSTKITESCLSLVKTMMEAQLPYKEKNAAQRFPIEQFRGVTVRYSDLLRDEISFIRLFESQEGRILPGRKYVASLSLFRGSKKNEKVVSIPDESKLLNAQDGLSLTLHQRLALYRHYMSQQYNISGGINVAIANIGFVVSSKLKGSGDPTRVFITLPIFDPEYLIYREGGCHSEVALIDRINRPEYIKKLIAALMQAIQENMDNGKEAKADASNGQKPSYKIYAVILDVHSQREVCQNCDEALHLLQTSYGENSFLRRLETQLNETGFLLPQKTAVREHRDSLKLEGNPKLPLIVRASGIEEPGYESKQSEHYSAPFAISQFSQDIQHFYNGARLHLSPRIADEASYNKFAKNPELVAQLPYSRYVKDSQSFSLLPELYHSRAHKLDGNLKNAFAKKHVFLLCLSNRVYKWRR